MDEIDRKAAHEFSIALATLGLRTKDFATEIGVSRDHVARLKSGKSRLTTLVKRYVALRLQVRRMFAEVAELKDQINHRDERDAAAERYRWPP